MNREMRIETERRKILYDINLLILVEFNFK